MKKLVVILLVVLLVFNISSALAWYDYVKDGSSVCVGDNGVSIWSINVDDWTVIISRNDYDGDLTDYPEYTGIAISGGMIDYQWYIMTDIHNVVHTDVSKLIYIDPYTGLYCDKQSSSDLWIIPAYMIDYLWLDAD